MGRAKLKMESIANEKKRNTAFKNKKQGLIKKMQELTVLCDVKACMIIYYGPKQEPQIWPENLNEVRGIIDMYRAKNKDKSRNKTYGLSDFFNDKKRKVENDLAKLRKENMEAKYPTWFKSLNFLTEPELRGIASALGNKAALVKSRIDLLKRNRAVEGLMGQGQGMNLMNFGGPRMDWSLVNQQQVIPSLIPNGMPLPHDYYPSPSVIKQEIQQQQLHNVNQNSMMNMLMNGTNNGDEFGSGFLDPVIWGNPGPVGWYNGPPMLPSLPMPPTYMQPPRQLQFLIEGEMILKYQIASEDLDTLISVKSTDDMRHMFDEIDGYETMGAPCLRSFLFPSTPLVADNHSIVDPHVLEQRYIDAINGILRAPPLPVLKQHPPLNSACSSPCSPDSWDGCFCWGFEKDSLGVGI